MKYNNLTRDELIEEVNKKDLENSSLKEIIQALERKIEELEEEIKELRAESPQTSEIKSQIQKRENWLKEIKESLEKIKIANTQNPKGNETKNNNFPTDWVVGGTVLLAIGVIRNIDYK